MSELILAPTFISVGSDVPTRRWSLGNPSAEAMAALQVLSLPAPEYFGVGDRLYNLVYSDTGAWWMNRFDDARDAPQVLFFAPYSTGVFAPVVTLPAAETNAFQRGYILAPYPGGIVVAHACTRHFYVITAEDGIILDQTLPASSLGNVTSTIRANCNNVVAVCYHNDGSAKGKIGLVIGRSVNEGGDLRYAGIVTSLATPGDALSYASDTVYVSDGSSYSFIEYLGAAVTAETGVEGVAYRIADWVYGFLDGSPSYLATATGSKEWVIYADGEVD
tara:strand:- start:136 stop:963 length:828 start_codon:yes stop_codon:yes gene_type:complete